MRHGGQAQRYRQPTLEAEATEEELKAISEAISAGVVTPASARSSWTTKDTCSDLHRFQQRRDQRGRQGDGGARREETRLIRKGSLRRQKIQEDEGTEEKAMPSSASRPREEGPELLPSASPTKIARRYPPHCAGIQAIEVHGDEEFDWSMVPEEVSEELQLNEGEDEESPITTEEHLKVLDQEVEDM